MKKLVVVMMMALGLSVNAQKNDGQTALGNLVIEANTGAFSTGNTGFALTSIDGNTVWSMGLDCGYFAANDLAIKTGFGYSDVGRDVISYKIGLEYYILSKIPVGIDYTGNSFDGGSTDFIGLQGGYAVFLSEHVSLKPTLRYNFGLEEGQKGAFQGLIGFALYF